MTTLYTNNAITTVATAVAIGDTTVTVKAGTGKLFGTPTGGSYQVATFCDPLFSVFEVVLITGRSTDTLTITRAQELTTAAAWPSGSNFFAGATAGVLAQFPQIASAASISGLWNFTTAPTINGASIWTSANITPAPINTTATITGAWQFNTLPNYYNGTSTFQFLTTNGGTLAGALYLAGDPTVTNQAATKNYVDSKVSGLTPHPSVSAASTGANVNVASAPATLDGVTLVNGNRILLKDQTTTSQNIVWVFNGAGSALTQASDFSGTISTQIQGTSVFVSGGNTNINSTWAIITSATSGTWGSVAVSWSQTGGAALLTAGNGINIASNTISVVVNTTNNLVSNSTGIDLKAITGLVANLGAGLTTGGSGSLYNNFTVDTYGRINAAANAPYALLTGAAFTGSLTRSTTPSAASDVTNVSYVQGQIATYVLTKQPVAAVATANVSSLSGLQTIDGYTLLAGDRVLLVGQTTASQNGVYTAASGAWTDARASDGMSFGAVYAVQNGTVNDNNLFMITNNGTITIGTTAITFARINGLGQITSPANASGGLSIVNNTISLYQSGVTAGTYNAATITVDAYGRITSASNNVSGVSSVFGRTGTVVAQTGDYNFSQLGAIPTTLAGYGITDPVLLRTGGTMTGALTVYGGSTSPTSVFVIGQTSTFSDAAPALRFVNRSPLKWSIEPWGNPTTYPAGTQLDINSWTTTTINGSPILTAATFGSWTYVGFTSTSTNITAVNNGNYSADTSTNVGTITLPATPSAGQVVTVQDGGMAFGTNNLTISRNGANIAGSANDLLLNQSGMGVTLVYVGTNKAGTLIGWAPYFNY